MNKIETEVIIVGAGYAGIAAATKLFESNKNFILLEARDRIGGRVNTQKAENSGETIDVGAQWIGPTQYLIWEWVKKYQVETFDCYDEGINIYHYKGKIKTYKGTIPKMNPIALLDLGIAMERLKKMSKKINLNAPWSIANAEKWDGITMDSWIRNNMLTKAARSAMHIGLETVFACQASEISLLHFLFYCHSGDDLDALLGVTNGAQQTLFMKGSQNLLSIVAKPFQDKIIFSQVVNSISQNGEKVIVKTDNLEVHAKKVIIALAPALCQKIKFSPTLPQRKSQLFQRMPMGAAMKCFVIYERPFWRNKGYSGQIVSDKPPLHVSFDCSKPDGRGILLFFVEGKNARDFIERPLEERKEKVLSTLQLYFGNEALKHLDYIDKCWTEEEYSGGCYAGNFTPGSWIQFGEILRSPIGNIHWAGTETAIKWCGYMDGAIASGYRAAEEVLKS
ncbi:MAG: FAD-dependent oxidoreductase [Chitinophagales bacterium]|nr:FAD-dependent oxidoreductase [Chitinophagales bacterium]MCZ2392647.1 FAD-dependent oxidoreductase [Chitinophagales bacterium]